MHRFYLCDYINEFFSDDADLVDLLKYELDKHIYYYGENFLYPREQKNSFRKMAKYNFLIYILAYYEIIKNNMKLPLHDKKILSNSYFSVNDHIKKLGFDVYEQAWGPIRGRRILANFYLYNEMRSINNILRHGNFKDLLDVNFLNKIKNFQDSLENFYKNKGIDALIVPNDMSFFENLHVKVFKNIGKPSFVFLHGLPGIYNNIDDNRADYLIVWGESIKQNYINAGVDSNKIFVAGHPFYQSLKESVLRFDIHNILIVTKAMNGSQHGSDVRLADRGNLVLYLHYIKDVLKKLGVKSVKLRLHPSENSKWYFKYIDDDFFKLDKSNLKDSLKNASLVIGPTSTLFLESIYYGVNYVVFEPSIDKIDLINYPLVPPFDGSDTRVPIAKNQEDLLYLLKNKVKIDTSVFKDYIKTPFEIDFLKGMI